MVGEKQELTKKNQELTKNNQELTKNNQELIEINQKQEYQKNVWRKIARKELPLTAGDYIEYKDEFDNFKTNLEILDCKLEVKFEKKGKNVRKGNFRFEWILTVSNPDSEPVEKAKFIFYGKNINPEVSIDGIDMGSSIMFDTTKCRKTGNEYNFLEIPFNNDESSINIPRIINIIYNIPHTQFNSQLDDIWLIPGVLGFAHMRKFAICLICDGFYINDKTVCQLKSYELNNGFENEKTGKKDRPKKLKDNKRGFEYCRENNEENMFEKRGFVLNIESNSFNIMENDNGKKVNGRGKR